LGVPASKLNEKSYLSVRILYEQVIGTVRGELMSMVSRKDAEPLKKKTDQSCFAKPRSRVNRGGVHEAICPGRRTSSVGKVEVRERGKKGKKNEHAMLQSRNTEVEKSVGGQKVD